MATFESDLALDLGCSTTRIYVRGRGVVASEPTVVAVRSGGRDAGAILAVGSEASRMIGRTPEDVAVVTPVCGGVVTDFECTEAMLRLMTPRAQLRRLFRRPRVVVAVPLDLSAVEQKAVRESVLQAGAREVRLIPKLMAAAIGLDLPVTRPTGHFIVDLGGGTTEIGVLSMSGVVVSHSLRTGGAELTETLRDYVRRKCNLLIGEQTAERLKIQLGSAYPTDDADAIEIRGRDLISGVPKNVEIQAEEVREALDEPVAAIVAAVRDCLERTPPELAADLYERGLVMVGGGSLLSHLDYRLREAIGIAVVRAENPLESVILGAGHALDRPRELAHLLD